jgi:hypothetical protein
MITFDKMITKIIVLRQKIDSVFFLVMETLDIFLGIV